MKIKEKRRAYWTSSLAYGWAAAGTIGMVSYFARSTHVEHHLELIGLAFLGSIAFRLEAMWERWVDRDELSHLVYYMKERVDKSNE